MGNSASAQVLGKGTMDLELTFGKILTLNDVYFVLEIRKNLVSVTLLNKFGFKLVVKGDKVNVTKCGVFVGKGYVCNVMIKLTINKNNIFAYITEHSSTLWHEILGHVNYKKMYEMSKEVIPKINQHDHENVKHAC